MFRPQKKLFHVWHVIYELHIQHIMKAEVQKAKTERARKMSSCVHTTAVLCKKNSRNAFHSKLLIIKQVIYETTKLWALSFTSTTNFFIFHFELDHSGGLQIKS